MKIKLLTSPSSKLCISSTAARLVISGITSSRIFNSRCVNKHSRDFRIPIITTNINGNRIDVWKYDLINHKTTRHANWIIVNRWTRFSGTYCKWGRHHYKQIWDGNKHGTLIVLVSRTYGLVDIWLAWTWLKCDQIIEGPSVKMHPYREIHRIKLASEYGWAAVWGKRRRRLSRISKYEWHVAHEHQETVASLLVLHIPTPISMSSRDLCSTQLQRQTWKFKCNIFKNIHLNWNRKQCGWILTRASRMLNKSESKLPTQTSPNDSHSLSLIYFLFDSQ